MDLPTLYICKNYGSFLLMIEFLSLSFAFIHNIDTFVIKLAINTLLATVAIVYYKPHSLPTIWTLFHSVFTSNDGRDCISTIVKWTFHWHWYCIHTLCCFLCWVCFFLTLLNAPMLQHLNNIFIHMRWWWWWRWWKK